MSDLSTEIQGPSASLVFATTFSHSPGIAPNLGTDGMAKYSAYYRCMLVYFFSVKRLYPEASLVVFLDQPLTGDWQREFDRLGVETKVLAAEHQCYSRNSIITNNFPGCLFLLDVIDSLSQDMSMPGAQLILCDADCLLIGRIDDLVEAVRRHALIAALPLDYELSRQVNGQSRASLTLLQLRHGKRTLLDPPYCHYGGEFLMLPMERIKEIAAAVEYWWQVLLAEVALFGTTYTEEHLLSLVINEIGSAALLSVEQRVKRIWTGLEFSNWTGSEGHLSLWHLPSEKMNFFPRMYRKISADSARLLSCESEEFLRVVLEELFARQQTTLRERLWERLFPTRLVV